MELNTVYLSLGSNLGDRIKLLEKSIAKLNQQGKIIRCSKVYETPPWGFESQDHFLNICLEYQTPLTPIELLDYINEIELDLGRIRNQSLSYESRPIDLDIIFFNNLQIVSERLTIPHPEYSKRIFVLAPLNDLVPDYLDSQLKKTIRELRNTIQYSETIKCLQVALKC
jgi:2-amino-4-hydroxy-6-hydroxymethyldihydropteridine diphosphokinase